MPRNRSEKKPQCPEAHAYARAADGCIAQPRGGDAAGILWEQIPFRIRNKISLECARRRSLTLCLRSARKHNVDIIRERYAA